MNNQQWMNAHQIYDAFGVTRSVLGKLANDGKVAKRTLPNDFGVINLYNVADLEKVMNGGDDGSN